MDYVPRIYHSVVLYQRSTEIPTRLIFQFFVAASAHLRKQFTVFHYIVSLYSNGNIMKETRERIDCIFRYVIGLKSSSVFEYI